MSDIQVKLLTDDILARFKGTLAGHCAHVSFLATAEAEAICQQIASREQQIALTARILTKEYTAKKQEPIYITVDKAIELRNRKQERLCLFVPADLVDAASSSLGNSFALIDGRSLHAGALKKVRSRLSAQIAQFISAVFAQLRGSLNVSDDQKLDFILAVLQHVENNEMANAGLELWRVGLIADAAISESLAREAFADADLHASLEKNRRCVLALSRPSKVDATTRERIQNLKVDEQTAISLSSFFHGKSLNNVRLWSQQIAQREELTFDRWIFPETAISNIRHVVVTPFVNASGRVERYCHLDQPDGDHGSLIARCGPKEKLVVKWKCEPEQPTNLGGWRVAIVPFDGEREYEDTIELPERDLPAQRRTITLNMNIELDTPPDFSVCVQVMPINKDGSVIMNDEEEAIQEKSGEFYLSKKIDEPSITQIRESKFIVPTLSYGRLNYAVEIKDVSLEETEPQWSSKDLDYFSVKLNNRRLLQLGLSGTLVEIERRTIAEPRKNSYYLLKIDTARPVSSQEIVSYTCAGGEQDAWKTFWRTRELLFNRLYKEGARGIIEVVEWTAELTGVALRYAQTYRELLDDLIERKEDPQQVRELLSIDSLLVRIAGRDGMFEEAIVTLPTHPLRVAWFVNYTQLLLTWEGQLLKLFGDKRKNQLDLQALRLLTPVNVPPFSYHALTETIFPFFQNLRFFHGVALPAGVPDPHRRYGDIAFLFGMTEEQSEVGDSHPEQLAEHLKNFLDLHPYTKTLVATLINPDRGNFFAEAMKQLIPGRKGNDEEVEQPGAPTFLIVAYTDNRDKSTLQAIGQLRQLQIDQHYQQLTDQFLPGIATISRPAQQLLRKGKLPEAHVAMVTDLTRPQITALMADELSMNGPTSFSLYGLVSRFHSQFSTEQGILRWQHRIITEGVRKPEAHPAGSRYSEALIDLHTQLLKSGGYLLSGHSDLYPALEVLLTEEQQNLLERLHQSTNWVVTLDRFFTLDYYDSPNAPGLRALARKYVLDYSPEFTDGLGHRMMVTTAWHEEIQSLLSQAMNDLGFAHVDQSVSHLLHHLKTISGRLALQALESPTTASATVGLGVVTAWLESKDRLKQGVLIPVDIYPRLFSLNGSGKPTAGERRCDLVLISFRRNIVDATFIEVKWRRGHIPYEELSKTMVLQMKSSATIVRRRFFGEGNRVDGALQRSYLANVLRFYFERSRRYGLFDSAFEASFLEHLVRLEKTGLDFRPTYEGYIVSLDGEERCPFPVDDARITILTARDFEQSTEFTSQISLSPEPMQENSANVPPLEDDTDENDEILSSDPSNEIEQSPSTREASISIVDVYEEDAETGQELKVQADPSMVPATTNHDQQAEAEPAPITIPLGEAAGSHLPVDWQPAIHGSPHLFILGIPGQGKSWTVTRILTELAQQQVPALVLDFHGQFADPHEPFAQAIHPTILDAAKGLPFSPFECSLESGSNGWRANTFAIAEIFAHVVGLGDMQRDIVYTAILEAYKAHGFRDDLDLAAADLTYPTLNEVLQRIENIAQVRHSQNVVARCRPLLEMNLFRPEEQVSDLLSLIRSGLVIDLHNLYVETLQQAAGAFVLRKIYKDMFSWGYARRLRLAIVLDEAHRLAKDVTLPKIMREGRKFGIAVIVASQGMADFHPDVLGTAGTKVIFRMNFPDSKKVAGFIRSLPGQDQVSRIEQLAVGSAYVQTPEMKYGSVVKMHPLK